MTAHNNKLGNIMDFLYALSFSLLHVLLFSSTHVDGSFAASNGAAAGSAGLRGFVDLNDIGKVLLGGSDHSDDRKLVSQCEGPDELYYFEVFIRLIPSPEVSSVCNVADQLMLGNDLNQLLIDHGVGDAGADDDAVFLAGICPQPTTTTAAERRRELKGLSLWGDVRFNWSGGGGCRFCLPETDTDARRQLSDWFTNTFVPQKTETLVEALTTTIIPDHSNCLGSIPKIDIELVQVGLDDLRIL